MRKTLFISLASIASLSVTWALPAAEVVPSALEERQTCANTATTRSCWGQYSVSTNSYTTVPSTGVTREYWLVVQNTTISPVGVARSTLNFNGTIPGPQITANWGDDIIVHFTNKLTNNGTSIHWHGMRQLNNAQYDGVPGVTQCPIAPGGTLTYKFHADNYGSSWYHSHFILQYGDGLFGPLVINGPATANYDVDLGALFLKLESCACPIALGQSQDRSTPNSHYRSHERDKHLQRSRLVNTAVDGHMQFSIDGHSFAIITNDFVPIVPYNATSLLVSINQRYNIIVTANAAVSNYWIRSVWQTACSGNTNAANITGILRYVGSSVTADPTTTTTVVTSTSCVDEPLANLVPRVPLNPTASYIIPITLTAAGGTLLFNESSLYLNWTDPTLLTILNGGNIWPTDYNVIPVTTTTANQGWGCSRYLRTQWVSFPHSLITNPTNPITSSPNHPIHLHGHDFWTLSQGAGAYTSATALNLVNPPRRDVMTLPSGGHLVIAFQIDNPGSWLMHYHIAWHASEGLALQFVETESSIVSKIGTADVTIFQDTCAAWDKWVPTAFPAG
ncbi:lcc1, laccase [Sclerotinia borealis F-4128]|uniref:Lcc1, laccase n=1 Tax=Sclerotinia borealis (strain F-4128) TaxID=1432307 RepID=W9CSV5_SCLBF|nr:lcc1, laccase [Sclerotinia borealis F-4128]